MTYRLELAAVQDLLNTLPVDALAGLPEVWALLELTPWAGAPWIHDNPGGALRVLTYAQGNGAVVYLVLEDRRLVDVIDIWWTH